MAAGGPGNPEGSPRGRCQDRAGEWGATVIMAAMSRHKPELMSESLTRKVSLQAHWQAHLKYTECSIAIHFVARRMPEVTLALVSFESAGTLHVLETELTDEEFVFCEFRQGTHARPQQYDNP